MKYLLFILCLPLHGCLVFITAIRNALFDWHIFRSKTYKTPIICIGNLLYGGTGKTPMVCYWTHYFLKKEKKIAILLRGYKRNTRGLIEVLASHSPWQVGDEAVLYKNNFPEVGVFVCKKRSKALDLIDKKYDLIIMDDGFQHRSVKPQMAILLFDYQSVKEKTLIFPLSLLREPIYHIKRADLLMLTKCPLLLKNEISTLKKKLHVPKNIPMGVSNFKYEKLVKVNQKRQDSFHNIDTVKGKTLVLVTGIAKSQALYQYLKQYAAKVNHIAFSDHHHFNSKDINKIVDCLNKNKLSMLISTEKDYVKLKNFSQLHKFDYFYIPISYRLYDDQYIHNFVEKKIKQSCN